MLELLIVATALAEEPAPRTVSVTARTVLKEMEWQGSPLALAIGPCNREACPLSVARGPAASRTWTTIATLGEADKPSDTLVVDQLDDAAWLKFGEYSKAHVAWAPVADVMGKPTVEVTMERGGEHVSHGWVLISLFDDTIWPIWSDWSTPRDVGWKKYRVVDVDGKQVLITQTAYEEGIAHEEHEQIDRYTYTWDGGGFGMGGDTDAPWWLLIAATTDTAEEAAKKRNDEPCLRDFHLLTTEDYPRLTQGKTVLAQVTASKASAEKLQQSAWTCAWDPYIKRGK